MFIEFVFKLVSGSLFILVARVIQNTRGKPFEFKWPEVRFNRKQTSHDLGPIFPGTALALG